MHVIVSPKTVIPQNHQNTPTVPFPTSMIENPHGLIRPVRSQVHVCRFVVAYLLYTHAATTSPRALQRASAGETLRHDSPSPVGSMIVALSLLLATTDVPCNDADPTALKQIVNSMALDGVEVRLTVRSVESRGHTLTSPLGDIVARGGRARRYPRAWTCSRSAFATIRSPSARAHSLVTRVARKAKLAWC